MSKVKHVLVIVCLVLGGQVVGRINSGNKKAGSDYSSLSLLLNRLDTDSLGPQFQLQTTEDTRSQGLALLAYFRSRNNVHHRINREDRVRSLGNIASQSDFELADDALKHIFVGQPAYPRFFCGDDIDWGRALYPMMNGSGS